MNYLPDLVDACDFGSSMRRAIYGGKPLRERSEVDGCLYAIFPVVGVGCLNFSAAYRHEGDFEQIRALLVQVFQDISIAVTTIVRAELASNLSVSGIR